MISKTHLKRIFSKATEYGSMGWERPSGRGSLWLSRGFIREYWDYQAEKFALIDQAYERLAGAFSAATAPATKERAQSVTSAGP